MRVAASIIARSRARATLRIARWWRATGAPASERELGFVASARPANRSRSRRRNRWARAADKLNEAVTHFEAADDDADARAGRVFAGQRAVRRARRVGRGGTRDRNRHRCVRAIRMTRLAFTTLRPCAPPRRSTSPRDECRHAARGTTRAVRSSRSAARRMPRIFSAPHELPVRAAVRRQHARVFARSTSATTTAADIAFAGGRDGAGQQGRRRRGEVARAISPAVHIGRGLHRAGCRGIRGAAAAGRSANAQPYQYAVLLGNYGSLPDRAR